jgi:hypothetical protein
MTTSYSLFDAVRRLRVESSPVADHLESFLPVLATPMGVAVSLAAMMAYRDVVRRKRDVEDAKNAAVRFRGTLRAACWQVIHRGSPV